MITPPEVEYRTIELTQGQVCYISPRLYDSYKDLGWYALKNKNTGRFYAVRMIYVSQGKRQMVIMHRDILGLGFGDPRTGDHRDHTRTLDNTDINLRIAPTRNDQQHNKGRQKNCTSGHKGVTFNKHAQRWEARIRIDGKRKWLGHFDTPELAYAAYCEAALANFGEFACFE